MVEIKPSHINIISNIPYENGGEKKYGSFSIPGGELSVYLFDVIDAGRTEMIDSVHLWVNVFEDTMIRLFDADRFLCHFNNDRDFLKSFIKFKFTRWMFNLEKDKYVITDKDTSIKDGAAVRCIKTPIGKLYLVHAYDMEDNYNITRVYDGGLDVSLSMSCRVKAADLGLLQTSKQVDKILKYALAAYWDAEIIEYKNIYVV